MEAIVLQIGVEFKSKAAKKWWAWNIIRWYMYHYEKDILGIARAC